MPAVALVRRFADGRFRKELRNCDSDVVRRRLEVLRLTKLGYMRQTVAEVVDVSEETVRNVVRAFNEHGFAGICEDKRRHNRSAPAITPDQERQLREALAGRAPDGGLWNGRKVGTWMASTFGIPVGKRLGSSTLLRLNFTLQRPQKRHVKGDAERQEEFKKTAE